jgi:hypothetical protein
VSTGAQIIDRVDRLYYVHGCIQGYGKFKFDI